MKKTVALLMLIVLSCSACSQTTSNLWDTKITFENFNETVKGIFITEDDDSLIFIAENYHYIFKADPLFVHAFRYPGSKNIQYSAEHARINGDKGTASVTIHMQLDPASSDGALFQNLYNIASEVRDNPGAATPSSNRRKLAGNIAALQHVLEQPAENGLLPVQLKLPLDGKIYQASENVNNAATRFETAYEIPVTVSSRQRKPLAVRIGLTPVTVAADGALTVGAVALGTAFIAAMIIINPDIKK